MATTEQTGESATGDRRAASGGVTGGSASAERLVERASALQVRAPELALILGERAAAVAEACGNNELWVRAESLAVHAKVRLGHRASTVGRAVTALRAAEDAEHPVIVAQLRTDLAVCARSVGAPLTGLAALRPVLTVGGLSSVQRAAALCHLVGCLGTFGRKVELDRVLMEGDRLISRDSRLPDDDRLIARALLRVGVSAHRRRHGDLVSAADAARTGIGFLDDLADPGADGGLARVRLVLELVCALLDRGDADLALEVAEPLLAEPERAAAVAPMAWLRLAVATRVHLVNGSAETAARTLREAVHSAGRHGLYALTARLWLELANVEERIGEASEAIQCLYRARSAEHLYTRVSSQARALLTGAFGAGEQAPVDLAEMVAAAAQAASAASGSSMAAQPPVQRTSSQPVTESGRQSGGRRRADERGGSSRPRVVLPMLRLAASDESSAPRSEPSRDPAANVAETPAPRTSTEDSVSATEVTAVTPVITDETQQPEPRRRRRKPEPADSETPSDTTRKTRHDAEHGSVAARSVLDRLGISPGGGGRRRAADKDEESSAPTQQAAPEQSEPRAADRSSSRAEPSERPDSQTDSYGWLPRLKLPPSLAPLKEDSVPSAEVSANGSGDRSASSSTTDHAEQFSNPSAAYGAPTDDPPPDAGLAELLARALAEHQAGTASAAALVRRLGVDDEQPPVNGKHRGNG
ncbi:hypothetical protein [Saccharomonospora cyanea]|uniref:Uncharacterized protein n=1 Tax=Saccharomonospora cyanea NA-134 TaxID=882082 RepID=H5XE63_9PSEU|nr:hypothetical protein [Saccharomonospora cyanea]EHR60309.1 hypothetical protein SaccyDRAFT_1403 [Saccharomonospora cyanea NA-134]